MLEFPTLFFFFFRLFLLGTIGTFIPPFSCEALQTMDDNLSMVLCSVN